MRRFVFCLLFLTNIISAQPADGPPAVSEAPTDLLPPGGPAGLAPVVEQCLPCVVQLAPIAAEASSQGADIPLPPGLPSLKIPFPKVWSAQQTHKQQFLPVPQAFGTGFLVDEQGHLVTNYHVVRFILERTQKKHRHKKRVGVVLHGGLTAVATVVATDGASDIALLKLQNPPSLKPVAWGDSQHVRAGDWVLAIGNGFGLPETATVGIVSHARRSLLIPGLTHVSSYLQVDAPAVNHGCSGGPLFNMKGQVIGMNTTICTPNGGNAGVAFAIPAADVQRVVALLKEHGHVPRGETGLVLSAVPVTTDMALALGLQYDTGALVEAVIPGSCAHGAGMRPHDIILRVGETPVVDAHALQQRLSCMQPGEDIELTFWRPTSSQSLKVKLLARAGPPDKIWQQEAPQPVQVGGVTMLATASLDHHLWEKFGWTSAPTSGVMLVHVAPTSVLCEFCRSGDVIQKIAVSGRSLRDVSTPKDIVMIMNASQRRANAPLLLQVHRPGHGVFYCTVQGTL